MEKRDFVICADIGGSHITAAIVDLHQKRIVKGTEVRTVVNCHGAAEEILESWAATLTQVRRNFFEPVLSVALAMPGPFDYQTGVSQITGLHKYESIYGINVKTYLAGSLAINSEDIRFRNDAEAFLHGEVIAGAASGFNKVIGFTLGTGMGSAISESGFTMDANWGSLPFGNSIADDYFSTRWFLETYALQSGLNCSNVKELGELAKDDETAAAVFNAFAENFAVFVENFLITEKPDLVLLGGNIAKGHHLFLKHLQLHVERYIDPECLIIGSLDEDAALIGAAFTF